MQSLFTSSRNRQPSSRWRARRGCPLTQRTSPVPHFANLIVFPFLILALGSPVNKLPEFLALVLGLLILLTASPRRRHATALASVFLIGISILATLMPLPSIEEGSNAFVPGYPQEAALAQALPEKIYATAQQMFVAAHPPESNCEPEIF